MNDIYKNILLSVFSGVLTSALLLVIAVYFRKIIVPWFRKLTYSGMDVSGSWFYVDEEVEAKMELTQNASSITGAYTYIPKAVKENRQNDIKIFSVNGEIKF